MYYLKKISQLGEGAQGVIYKCEVLKEFNFFLENTNKCPKFVALKRIKKLSISSEISQEAIREIKILSDIKHPNVMQAYDIFVHKKSIHIVLPLMKTDLFAIICTRSLILQSMHIKNFLQQILKGLQHLHKLFIIHRDLKPSNCLIGYDNILRISDFGFAREYGSPCTLSPQTCTLWYRAPELLYGSQNYSIGMDVWSVGCIFVELLLRKPFFQGKTEIEQLTMICSVFGNPTNVSWPYFQLLPQYYKFSNVPALELKRIFPSSTKATLNLIKSFFVYNPSQRITAKKALEHPYFREEPKICNIEELPLVDFLSQI